MAALNTLFKTTGAPPPAFIQAHRDKVALRKATARGKQPTAPTRPHKM